MYIYWNNHFEKFLTSCNSRFSDDAGRRIFGTAGQPPPKKRFLSCRVFFFFFKIFFMGSFHLGNKNPFRLSGSFSSCEIDPQFRQNPWNGRSRWTLLSLLSSDFFEGQMSKAVKHVYFACHTLQVLPGVKGTMRTLMYRACNFPGQKWPLRTD